MLMRLGDLTVSVIPVAANGRTKYKNVRTGEVYSWDELTPMPHTTRVSSLTDSAASMTVGVKIGVTATQVMRSGDNE